MYACPFPFVKSEAGGGTASENTFKGAIYKTGWMTINIGCLSINAFREHVMMSDKQ